MTFVVLMALCNQPEAFASDLGDDQSRYLHTNVRLISLIYFGDKYRMPGAEQQQHHCHLAA